MIYNEKINILFITTVDICSTLNMCGQGRRARPWAKQRWGWHAKYKVNPIVYNKATRHNLLTYTLIWMFIQG